MMKRFLAVFGASVLAITSSIGFVAAQDDTPVNANGSSAVANDDGSPVAIGAGEDIVYGDVNTGGSGGEVLGDPSAVYAPARPDHPGRGEMIVMPGAGDGMIGGVPIMPPLQPTAPDNTATTNTSLNSTEGNTSENVPLETTTSSETPTDSSTTAETPSDTSAPVESATEATEGDDTSIGFCESYAVWYDAQVAYENMGATAADPALVQEVDPDYDGIACEQLMA